MPTLRELQAGFAAAVVGGRAGSLGQWIEDDAPGAEARLAIYCNHYRITLVDALAATYPVTAAIVGDAFFRAAARGYVLAAPPQRPCLFEYGAGFPDHLQRLPQAASVPYLGDVARLEWVINEARHAADAPAVDAATAARAATAGVDLRIGLHPSCRFVVSPFAVDRVWLWHRQADGDPPPVVATGRTVRLLVHRRGEDVGWIRLGRADLVFLHGLAADAGPGRAMDDASTEQDGFDPTPLLASLLRDGLLVTTTPACD